MSDPAEVRPFFRRVFWDDLTEHELENPNFETVLKVVWHTVRTLFRQSKAAASPTAAIRVAQVISTSFILLML